MNHNITKYFDYGNLPDHLKNVSRPFGELAVFIDEKLPVNAESATALRKLLEAWDCAIRAMWEEEKK